MGGTCFRNARGVTLIEVMTVVIILALIVAIAVPSLRSVKPRYQLAMAKREIISVMQLARMKAVSSGHCCYIDFSGTDTYTCFLDTNDNTVGEIDNHDPGLPKFLQHEYSASGVTFNARKGNTPCVQLPSGIAFGTEADLDINGTGIPPADGISFSGNPHRAIFYPNSRGKLGTVYLGNVRGDSYAIWVNIVGRVFLRQWDAPSGAWEDR